MLFELSIISISFLILIFFFIKKNYQIASYLNIFDDVKSSRKIKKIKTPLTGGLIIMSFIYLFSFFNLINFEIIVFAKYNFNSLIYFFLLNLIFILGFLDDKIDLSPNIKLISFILIFSFYLNLDSQLRISYLQFKDLNLTLNIYSFSFLFVVFCLIVFINAANMFDGINLQCSCYFLFLNIYLFLILKTDLFLLFLIIGLLLFIFLNYNNKSYLGDSGVYLIAFITATIIIKMYNNGYLFCDQILLMMLIPGIDLIILTFIRIYNCRHPFKADNFHIHHILRNNFNEKKVFLIIFSLISIPNILAYLFDTFLIFIMISIGLYFYIIKTYNNGIKKI